MATSPIDNHFELDADLTRRVEKCAESNGISPTQVVHEAIEEYLSAHGTNGGPPTTKRRGRLSEIADDAAAHVPDEEWAKLPADLAKNFEHYRYGYPRED